MNEEPNKKDSLKKQSAWLLFAKTAGFGFAFILPLIITRVLSLEKVGVYRQSFQVVMNAISILSFGVAMSAFYYLSRETEKRAAAIFNILLFHFLTGGIAFFALFFFPHILGNLFQSPEMTHLAPLIGVVIWIWIFSMFLETVAIANQESILATVFIIFAQFSKTALMVCAVVFYDSVESIIYAAIVQGAIQTVILLVYLNSRFPAFLDDVQFQIFERTSRLRLAVRFCGHFVGDAKRHSHIFCRLSFFGRGLCDLRLRLFPSAFDNDARRIGNGGFDSANERVTAKRRPPGNDPSDGAGDAEIVVFLLPDFRLFDDYGEHFRYYAFYEKLRGERGDFQDKSFAFAVSYSRFRSDCPLIQRVRQISRRSARLYVRRVVFRALFRY